MIPAALKGKAERLVGIQDEEAAREDLPAAMTEWMGTSGQLVKLEVLLERFPEHAKAVKSALREGVLVEQTSIRDRLAVRKVLTVFVPEDAEGVRAQMDALPPRAAKQREVLAYMLEHGGPLPLGQLLAQAGGSAASVRSLAEKGLLELREVEQQRDPYAGREFERTTPLALTEGQQGCICPDLEGR